MNFPAARNLGFGLMLFVSSTIIFEGISVVEEIDAFTTIGPRYNDLWLQTDISQMDFIQATSTLG